MSSNVNVPEENLENLVQSDGAQISGPIESESSTIVTEIISLDYSFGYDCRKLSNLVLIEPDVLVFGSGNLIHFYRISTEVTNTRRSVGGGGIGCVAKNPQRKYNYLTVAENGAKKCNVYIYKYPEMKVISILKNATINHFTRIDYSADGEFLGTQGGDPDYMLTIWDWKKAEIKLRAKSFFNDVLNLQFSPSIPGHLTTSGFGHIKFWKMSQTFSGLKLQGALGRFGKTEICDILGIYPMPDEKVLSGCEWGNILVWEAGLIKVEVCRRSRKPLHKGPITQILIVDSDVITVGSDGYVRTWFWETVELADPPEDDRIVEIEPINEFRIGQRNYKTQLLQIVKREEKGTLDWLHYAQDANGGIWVCDLAAESKPQPPKQLFQCHAGPIVGLGVSPISCHIATLGDDGRLHLYNYITKKLTLHYQFHAAGRDLIWLPATIDPSGTVLILGFDDGVIRMVAVDVNDYITNERVLFIQVTKAHSKGITKLSINEKKTILVSGSEDKTLFIHQLDFSKDSPYVVLKPIGFIMLPSIITCLNWNPLKFATCLIGCAHGQVIQADLPEQPRSYTDITYHLKHIPLQEVNFKSSKSQIRRNIRIKAIEAEIAAKRAKKVESLENLRAAHPELEILDEDYLEDSDTEPMDLEPIYIPPPNPVLWVQYTLDNTWWFSMGGFDAGYIYEFDPDNNECVASILIPNADDIEIHSYIYFDQYLIFGMGDGSIRINRMKEDWRDLSDYWILNMHDNMNGKVSSLRFSCDNKFFFSVGSDGNLFSYNWNLEIEEIRPLLSVPADRLKRPANDIIDPNHLSLEQQKLQEEIDRKLNVVNDHKNDVLKVVAQYRAEFDEILAANERLPESQRLTQSNLEMDRRITIDLQEDLNKELAEIKAQHAFVFEKVKLKGERLFEYFINPLQQFPIEVLGINNKKSVFSFRIRKLSEEFMATKKDVDNKIRLEEEKRKFFEDLEESYTEKAVANLKTDHIVDPVFPQSERLESFLIGLSPDAVENKLQSKMKRLLSKYRERKAKEIFRQKEWEKINAEKPDSNFDHPDDVKALEDAVECTGDYKLKTDPDYEPPDETRDTTLRKLHELLCKQEEIFNLRENYNKKIFELRDQKGLLIDYVKKSLEKLKETQLEIHPKQRIIPKVDVKFDESREFPERNFQLETYLPHLNKNQSVPVQEVEESAEKREIRQLLEMQRDILGITDEIAGTARNSKEPPTEWELEMRNARMKRKLFEQDRIILKINERISEFDKQVEQLSQDRFQVELDAKFLDLYILTLNQELFVLKDFEQLESKMEKSVEDTMMTKSSMFNRIVNKKKQIEDIKRNVDKLKEDELDLAQKFATKCADNKFSDFFRKIFKKKFKPPKPPRENGDSEEESCSDSSSEDNESDGSAEDSYKHLDINECPKNCDKNLYKLSFALRDERHALEQEIELKEKTFVQEQTNLDGLYARSVEVDTKLQSKREELAAFRLRKQQTLNEIDTLMVLKMDQMQYFKSQEDFEDIDQTLLFNNANVLKLYARVGQLALETIEAKRKHRVNVIHLAKMKTDVKHMERIISDLREQTSQAMIKKFGRIVNLDELEETILRRFAYEMRSNVDDIKSEYTAKINEVKKIRIKAQEELNKDIQDGTEKLNVLTVLEEEANYIDKMITSTKKWREKATTSYMDFGQDMNKLKEIVKHQKNQIAMLQREIRALTLKTKSFALIEPAVQSLEYKVKKVREDGMEFQDSIFSYMESRENTPDLAYTKISKIAQEFVEKVNLHEINEASKVVKYLSHVAVNYTSGQAEELLPQVDLNLKKILPANVEITCKQIEEFFEIIAVHFKNEAEVNLSEVAKAVVANAIELNESSPKHDPQNILLEIVQQLVNTLKPEEFLSNKCLAEVVKEIQKVPYELGMNSGLLNACEVAEMVDLDDVEISANDLRSAVGFIVSQLAVEI